MEFNRNDLEDYVNMLTDNLDLVDELSDDVVEYLIEYVEAKIKEKDKILSELKKLQTETDI